MAAYTVKTINDNRQTIPGVFEELQTGKARIGWSNKDNLDLRLINEKIQQREYLTKEEQKARRCLGFLTRVNIGDYLIYPHQPERNYFIVVRVEGEYDYSAKGPAPVDDFRSFRPCSLMTPEPVAMYDKTVPSQFRRRLGTPGRFSKVWDTTSLDILSGSLAAKDLPEGSKPENLLWWRIDKELRESILKPLHREFSGAGLSRNFCCELFERMGYSSEDIHVQEGRGESGSDIVVTVGIPYLLPDSVDFRVGVQVFCYEGAVDKSALESKLEQLIRGWEKNSLNYGLLLTTEVCSKEANATIDEHNKNNSERLVRLIDGNDLADLFRQYFLPEND